MPRQDRTGPVGMGPMTGRGLGPCGGFPPCGWGMGMGWGRGLGRYFGWGEPQTKKAQIEALSDYKNALDEELEDIKKELKELGKGE